MSSPRARFLRVGLGWLSSPSSSAWGRRGGMVCTVLASDLRDNPPSQASRRNRQAKTVADVSVKRDGRRRRKRQAGGHEGGWGVVGSKTRYM
ncbi:hypothetical protein C8R47DRAFT_1165661 [Mycena vitilis]|nr:hypothetical protein C8R47DRAFT_1166662 [Mycena vitilis]KAJ6456006.1 hypothetical protein C8R47DRAFT_1165661 [Mycena vitilis]